MLRADSEHRAKSVFQALPSAHKKGIKVVQADTLNFCHRLWRQQLQIDRANTVCLFCWKRRQKQVKAVEHQGFKLVVAKGIWSVQSFHKPSPTDVPQQSIGRSRRFWPFSVISSSRINRCTSKDVCADVSLHLGCQFTLYGDGERQHVPRVITVTFHEATLSADRAYLRDLLF